MSAPSCLYFSLSSDPSAPRANIPPAIWNQMLVEIPRIIFRNPFSIMERIYLIIIQYMYNNTLAIPTEQKSIYATHQFLKFEYILHIIIQVSIPSEKCSTFVHVYAK